MRAAPCPHRVCAYVLTAALLALAAPAAGQELREQLERGKAPFDVSADSLEYDRARDVYLARGHVRIEQPGRVLEADWAAFGNRSGRGLATGNVVVREGADVLHAELLEFELDSERGLVLEGRLDASDSRFRMRGREIRKTGPASYAFEEGRFTTCDCPDGGTDPWTITAESAELEADGSATARNAAFEVFGVPVVWLPWVVFPLRTGRETGFLLPEVSGASRNGAEVGLPFFWAVHEQLGVTVTPRWLSQRGFMPHGELEYVFGERSGGRLEGAFIHDGKIDPDDPETPFDQDRWGAEWIHEQDLSRRWRLGVDARAFSDNLYPFDFRDFGRLRDDRFSHSTAFVEGRFGPLGRTALSASTHYADDLQNPDDQDRDRFLLQNLPHVALDARPRPLWGGLPVVASLDADYDLFWSRERSGRVYPSAAVVGDDLFLDVGADGIPTGLERNASGVIVPGDAHADDGPGGTEGDGRFQEGEPLADRGHRAILNPRLALPFRLFDVLEVWPEVGWHGTLYETRAQAAELRSLFTGQLDLRARLRRALRLPGIGSATHVLEPRLAWTAVSSDAQDGNPLLVPAGGLPQERLRQLALENVTRDPADRVRRTSAVTAALGNRFYVAGEGGTATRLLADMTLSFQYDLARDDPGALLLDGMLRPGSDLRARFHVNFDPEEARVDETLLRFGWSSEAGNDLGLEYRFRRELPRFFEAFRFDDERFGEFTTGFSRVNQLTLFGRASLTRHWALTYEGAWSFENSLFLANAGGVEYVSRCDCWALRLEVADERTRGVDISLRYTLLGLGDDRVRPFGRGAGRFWRDPVRRAAASSAGP